MKPGWDVIIIGARIAGATLASYLGSAGLRVLLVDRASFPSDIPQQASWDITVNRHWNELNILVQIERAGVPRQTAHYFSTDDIAVPYHYADFGALAFRMTARRATLDHILSQHAASFPSVELRTGFPVHGLLWEGDRIVGIYGGRGTQRISETGWLVVGADGRHSWMARQVDASVYEEVISPWAAYIAHYQGTNVKPGMGYYARTADTFFVAGAADADFTIASVSIRNTEVEMFRRHLPHSFTERLLSHPRFQEAIGAGILEGAIGGAHHLSMYKRVPYGPGWALVGDAGYHLDPMAARGVTAAVVSARLLADAILEAMTGQSSLESALREYQQKRDKQLAREWSITHSVVTKGPPDEADRARARLLRDHPNLCRLQMLAQFGLIPMTEFNQAVAVALKD